MEQDHLNKNDIPSAQLAPVPQGQSEVYRLISSIVLRNLGTRDSREWLVNELCQVLDVDAALMMVINDRLGEIVLRMNSSDGPCWEFYPDITQEDGQIGNCIKAKKSSMLNEVTAGSLSGILGSIEGLNVANLVCAPLLANDQAIGVLAAVNKKCQFTTHDLESLALIANVVANMISNERLIRQLKVANADLEASRWQLLNSRNTLRTLFDSIPTSIYIVDRKYNLASINTHRAGRINELPSQLVGRRCYEALYQREDICPDCRVLETLFNGKSTNRTRRHWEVDGEPQEWEIASYPILDSNNQVVQAILLEQDVTEKRRLEATLAQSEKLAAVGQLAAGIAHEINNPLAVILANAQLLQRELEMDDDKQELVDLIMRAGARATQVVRNLLDLARKEQYDFAPLDVNETIRKALTLLQHEFVARSIQLVFDPQEDLPEIKASEDHLQGVWINLLTNAFDALEEGNREIRISSRLQGNEIRVSISDTGRGIPPERLSRIFEPFYTTKAPGRGTGLGLSVCHRVIKQHGGRILVDSQLGVGTQFTIILPVV